MKKPIIGIMMRSDELDDNRSVQYVYDGVRQAIIRSGGEPLLLCPPKDIDYFKTKWHDFSEISDSDSESINYWLNMCDALFLPGGIKYSKYDLFVLDLALKKNMPILGVCLGMQIMSNYKKDFKIEKINSNIVHCDLEKKYCHKVTIEKNSLLYKILDKTEIKVNSYHKMQAFKNPLFDVVARAEDDVIEALEMREKRFVLGVQWHPEKMIDYDESARKIMNSFIDEARIYKDNNDKARLVKI